MKKDFDLLEQTTDIFELIQLLPNLNYNVQKFFYQNSPLAKQLINYVLTEQNASIYLGEITKEPFFLFFLLNESMVDFRNNINQIAKYNASYEFFQNIRKYYETVLESYDESVGLFDIQKEIIVKIKQNLSLEYSLFYTHLDKYSTKNDSPEELIEYFKKKDQILLSDIIVDYLFEDNYYNVLINIKEILCFQKNTLYLSKERIHFYQEILRIDNMSNKEKLNLYQKYRNQDVSYFFYDDIRFLKNISYQKIKKDLFDIKKWQEEHLPAWHLGVKIYDLRKEKYIILQRTLDQRFKKSTNTHRRSCYNLICEKKNPKFGKWSAFSYGYSSFDESLVLHISENDSYSQDKETKYQKTGTNTINRIMNLEDILFSSQGINEIQILNEKIKDNIYMPLLPDFIIVYNKIRLANLIESIRLHVPIVLLKKVSNDHSYSSDSYFFYLPQEKFELQKRMQNVCKR